MLIGMRLKISTAFHAVPRFVGRTFQTQITFQTKGKQDSGMDYVISNATMADWP